MHRSIAGIAMIAAVLLPGCSGPHPSIRGGDANSVDVMYSGDIASALPLAREYCARYGRRPELADATPDIATFSCLRR